MLKTKTTKVVTTLLALALVLSATVVSADTLSSTTFNTNLTVGSRGADVSALQTILISKGLLTAVSAPTGYFGNATKAALAAYQTSEGITPAVGYFGAITRAKINLTSGTATGPATSASCPAGYTCTATTGTISTSTGTVATGGEGTLDVKISAAPASNGNIQTKQKV